MRHWSSADRHTNYLALKLQQDEVFKNHRYQLTKRNDYKWKSKWKFICLNIQPTKLHVVLIV